MLSDEKLIDKRTAEFNQCIKFLDVFVFAPILIYIGLTGKLTDSAKAFLIFFGFAAIIYNFYYFFKYKNEQ